jgi:hypothetical protein
VGYSRGALLVLLHASLLLRTVRELLGWWAGRQWSGLFYTVAIRLFLITLVWVVLRGRIARHRECPSYDSVLLLIRNSFEIDVASWQTPLLRCVPCNGEGVSP